MKLAFALLLALIAVSIFPFNASTITTVPGLMFAAMSVALFVIAYRLIRKVPSTNDSVSSTDAQSLASSVTVIERDPSPLIALSSNEEYWAKALAEFDGPARRLGLWAQALSEENGNEERAKATYLRRRVAEIQSEPPAFFAALRDAGYTVEHRDSRWSVTGSRGGVTRYFNSIHDLEAQVNFLLQHAAASDA
jgi:hypothetical protein